MKKEEQDIDIKSLKPYEICFLKGEVIRLTNIDAKGEEFTVQAFEPKVTYKFKKIEFHEIENTYNELYPLDGTSESDLFLYDNMFGITKRNIVYPGLNSCIGITIILKNTSKIGTHFVLPMSNYEVAERYIINIKHLFNILKNPDNKVSRVEVSGENGLFSIMDHIEYLAKSEIFVDIIEMYMKPLFEIAGLKIGRDDKGELAVINYTSGNTQADSDLRKTANSKYVCIIKYNF